MKIYKAVLDPDGWNEPEVIGYFKTKEKAWEECFKSHSDYKDYRIQIYYKRRETLDDPFIRDGFRYDFYYKHYHIKEIEVKE